MDCMAVLQNCMCFVDGGTGSCSETCVECDVDGTGEVSIKVEETIDIKDEMPEAISFPPIKTENEVRLRDVCEFLAAHDFRPLVAPPQKGNCKLHLFIPCFFILWVHLSSEIWISILKRRDFLEVIAINGRLILKCILKK